MTIQRQYSLPNCTLILEGVGEEAATLDSRPLLNVLVNAECRFVGQEQPIAGGSEFFENLVAAVTRYSQEVLSGIPSPAHRHAESSLVDLQADSDRYHRLIVRAASSNGNGSSDGMTELRLSSVQLFDLVEAIDQALADSQTLPHLSLQLQPISKRRAQSGEPLSKRALPAALGLSSLAVAAAAFFFIPNPEVRRVEEEPASQSSVEAETNSTDEAATGNPPDGDVVASEANLSADAADADAENADDFDTVLEGADPLTDEDQVSQLNRDLRSRLEDALDPDGLDVDEDLEYRVALSEDGNIVGYRYLNDAAVNAVARTPLPDLRRRDQAGQIDPDQRISQHRVVITPRGIVEVSPWYATSPSPDVDAAETDASETDTTPTTSTTPVAEGENITDTATLETLTRELRSLIIDNYEAQEFPAELMYRVTFDQEGQVLAIAAENDAAENLSDTDSPLAELEDDLNPRSQAPRTDFMVVFTEDGIPQVSPWDGY